MARYMIDNIPSPIDFSSSDAVGRTLQNAKNLLMCRMFEVPFDRYRGLDPEIFDLPAGEMQAELMPELDRLMTYEPDVEVAEAEAVLLEDGSTYIRVVLDLSFRDASGEESEEGQVGFG